MKKSLGILEGDFTKKKRRIAQAIMRIPKAFL